MSRMLGKILVCLPWSLAEGIARQGAERHRLGVSLGAGAGQHRVGPPGIQTNCFHASGANIRQDPCFCKAARSVVPAPRCTRRSHHIAKRLESIPTFRSQPRECFFFVLSLSLSRDVLTKALDSRRRFSRLRLHSSCYSLLHLPPWGQQVVGDLSLRCRGLAAWSLVPGRLL